MGSVTVGYFDLISSPISGVFYEQFVLADLFSFVLFTLVLSKYSISPSP